MLKSLRNWPPAAPIISPMWLSENTWIMMLALRMMTMNPDTSVIPFAIMSGRS